MHGALWKLYRLRIRGSVRSILSRVTSVRGAALALFTLLVFFLMFGQNLLFLATQGPARAMGHGTDSLQEILPVGMLLYCVLAVVSSLGQRAIYFSPADVDFLFPAPFSRREILLYKILGTASGAVFIALILATSLVVVIRSWPAAVIGAFLAVLLVNSVTLCFQLVAQTISERAFSLARRGVLFGLLAAAVLAFSQTGHDALEGNWQETLRAARYSAVAQVLLAPFAVYANIISAERLLPDALGWTALGAALVVAVYAAAVRLDANYLETAASVSRQIQERVQRAAREGVFARPTRRPTRSSRLPQPPWFGGAGPLAWRQTVQSLRGARGGLVFTLVIVAMFAGPYLLGSHRSGQLPTVLPSVVIGAAVYVTFLFSAQVPLGFRGDYERMELLKSLPIRPVAFACGQMLVVVVLATLLQWSLFGITAAVFPASWTILLVAGLFALPFNWILFGVEDLFFLLYPSPMVPTASDGLLKAGRVMLFMLAKLLVLGACAVVAAIPAAGVYLLTESLALASAVAWAALIAPEIGILLLVAWAFHRFDVTAMGERA